MPWFLSAYPDMRRVRLHPLDHYLLFGWREGRNPKPGFDGRDYVRRHPECAALGMNPLQHLLSSPLLRPASSLTVEAGDSVTGATQLGANSDATVPGSVRVIDGAVVEGWLDDSVDETEVEVRHDGTIVWRGAPRLSLCLDDRTRRRGFRVDLPEAALHSNATAVEVLADGRPLTGSPLRVELLQRFRGALEAAEWADGHLELEGWAQDRARPLDPVSICVERDGETLATLSAD